MVSKITKIVLLIYFLICYPVSLFAESLAVPLESVTGNGKIMLRVLDSGGKKLTNPADEQDMLFYCFCEAGGINRLLDPGNPNSNILQAGYLCQIFPPGSISSLTCLTPFYGKSIKLQWTSPGEEEYSGKIATGEFALQYSSNPIPVTLTGWATSYALVVISTSNSEPGQFRIYQITSAFSSELDKDVTYYFKLWARNTAGEWSDTYFSTPSTLPKLKLLAVSLLEPTTYNFGSIGTSLEVVSNSGIVSRNNGNILETYKLNLTTGNTTLGTVWTPSVDATAGNDEFVLYSIFKSTKPETADFGDILYDDILSTGTQFRASTTRFSAGTPPEHDGVRVQPIGDSDRAWNSTDIPLTDGLLTDTTMWFKLKTPINTSTIDEQTIFVIITAEDDQ